MRSAKVFIACVAGTTALIYGTACGGGSGGGGSITPPTCADAIDASPSVPANVEIPQSTYHRLGRAHTNHLILKQDGRAPLNPGYTPDQIRKAYGIPAGGGSGTIVVVDAFHNPSMLEDFNAFSAAFGLPQETSLDVTAPTNQHLQLIYQSGSPPAYNAGWSQESALDIQWVHAMAPNAKIVVIESPSDNLSNLMAADDMAATVLNAHQCSNSWSAPESAFNTGDESHFQHTGMVYYFASGDTGGVRDYPPTSPNVVAVGGTTLNLGPLDTRLTETAWSGTGCGMSGCVPRPSFQDGISDIVGSARGVVDVSAVADPVTGVRVRWQGTWHVFGGTSAACPIIAGIANVAGTNRSSSPDQNAFIYSRRGTSSFFDVTSGKAGMFNATTGWDFPTGVGTPNGTSGF